MMDEEDVVSFGKAAVNLGSGAVNWETWRAPLENLSSAPNLRLSREEEVVEAPKPSEIKNVLAMDDPDNAGEAFAEIDEPFTAMSVLVDDEPFPALCSRFDAVVTAWHITDHSGDGAWMAGLP